MELQFCVSHYGNDGVSHLYAEHSACNIVSPGQREAWLAGRLTQHILTRTSHPDSGHRL
jgi:hypothetical protein